MAQAIASIQSLEKFSVAVLCSAGLDGPQARIVSESLLFADLRGVDSHGIIRLSTYLDRIRSGVMELNPRMTTEQDSPALALIDAHNGFGQIAGVTAMDTAIEKAHKSGVAAVAVKNSNHFGVAAYFAVKALATDMIGAVLTNASPGIAPYGTRKALLGTNPLAIAVPAWKQRPIVLDMATSVVARGKIRMALLAGKKIPLDWALDEKGEPTDDPNAALKGTMAAVGGPKGAGLSLMIDLLCGVLSGSCLTGDVLNITDLSGPCRTGHLMIAIDPSKFVDSERFRRDVDEVIRRTKALPPVKTGPVYLPGELEAILEEKRRREGIPLDDQLQSNLSELAVRYGVQRPDAVLIS